MIFIYSDGNDEGYLFWKKVVIARCLIFYFSIDQSLLRHKQMGWGMLKRLLLLQQSMRKVTALFITEYNGHSGLNFLSKKFQQSHPNPFEIFEFPLFYTECPLTKAYFNLSMDCKFKTICILHSLANSPVCTFEIETYDFWWQTTLKVNFSMLCRS